MNFLFFREAICKDMNVNHTAGLVVDVVFEGFFNLTSSKEKLKLG